MPVSTALIRWSGGWHEYTLASSFNTFGRREAFLSLGAVQSVSEARRLTRQELEGEFGKIREQSTVEHRPANIAEVPYTGYKPGDRLPTPTYSGSTANRRVLSIAVTEDDDGVITFVPALGDRIVGVEEFQAEVIRANQQK